MIKSSMIPLLNLCFLLLIWTSLASPLNIIVNTWTGVFENATYAAYNKLISSNATPVDAIEVGGSTCEDQKCDGSVGYGDHPDTRGHTSLDAMIMDGSSMDVGCVGYIRKYRQAISLARQVMVYTDHTFLVGQGAEEFADMIGILQPASATTNDTISAYHSWLAADCQPNYYTNLDGADNRCGPYKPIASDEEVKGGNIRTWANRMNHDTIGLIALDVNGRMACGTTTNGANHKVAGRVGDSPIVGSGCYVSDMIGGAAATGDGDVMMRFLPSYTAVLYMEHGLTPQLACERALYPIIKAYPSFSGGMVCMNKDGVHGAAAYNMNFAYSMMSDETQGEVQSITVQPIS